MDMHFLPEPELDALADVRDVWEPQAATAAEHETRLRAALADYWRNEDWWPGTRQLPDLFCPPVNWAERAREIVEGIARKGHARAYVPMFGDDAMAADVKGN